MIEELEKPESEEGMDIDEVELTLRRFAMSHNNQPLTKLLNSMFPTGIAVEEVEEDKKEGEE